jgi:hypothetical protein
LREITSSPSVGSSRIISRASMAAIKARWVCTTMPLDRLETLSRRLTSVRASRVRARSAEKRGCRPPSIVISSDTRAQRGSTATSGIQHTCSSSFTRSRKGSRPSTRNCPWAGSRPTSAFISVVLPAPLWPSRPNTRPLGIWKLTWSTAVRGP